MGTVVPFKKSRSSEGSKGTEGSGGFGGSESSDEESAHSEASSASGVLEIQERREALIQEDRRQVRRTILTEFIAVHTILPGVGLLKVVLVDINEKGLAFDVEQRHGHFAPGEMIELRIYLNHRTYFKVEAKVNYVRDLSDEGLYRQGCQFGEDSLNSEALHHFVRFLETVTASLKRDKGDIMVPRVSS